MNKELYEALEALCQMWHQYCLTGHDCMLAGESTEEVLDKYDLLLKKANPYGGKIDWEKLDEIEKTINE